MPRQFSNREYADILFIYGFCNGNGTAAKTEYGRRFPDRRLPNRKTFIRVFNYLGEHGRFPTVTLNEHQERRHLNMEQNILNIVNNNPGISTRRIGHATNVPHVTVWRRLKKHNLYPFHIQEVQRLQAGDEIPRMNFSNWIIRNARILSRVLFTDEAQFTRDGVYNLRNSHIWAEENPFATREAHSQHKFSVNVWCGVIDNKLIGPHIFPHRLTGEVYLDFLQNILPVLLDDADVNVAGMYYQHDGASVHYRVIVRNFLNENFPNLWIGRGGPNNWPSRSPDFNPVDYHIWGYLKSKVYATDIDSREELLRRIENACGEIRNNPDVIRRSVRNITKRARKCIEQNGGHFEQFL